MTLLILFEDSSHGIISMAEIEKINYSKFMAQQNISFTYC